MRETLTNRSRGRGKVRALARPARSPLSATVSGLAAAAGVTPHVVRYYTRIGLLQPLRDPSNNYMRFNGRHLARLNFVLGAKALGYTLGEIRRIFKHAEHGRSPCPEVRGILQRRVAENRLRLQEFAALQERMERALARWEKMLDQTPSGDSVCHLIESMEES